MPSISGSVAVTLSVTLALFVATAPPSICTVPLGGVASMRVVWSFTMCAWPEHDAIWQDADSRS